MPLPVLLALVVGGIGTIAVLLHLLGYSRAFDLSDEATIRAQWARHFPDDTVRAVLPAPDGRAALVETDSGPGLLWVMGADTAAHRLAGARISENARGLRISLNDFAAPGVTVALPPEDRAAWRDKARQPA